MGITRSVGRVLRRSRRERVPRCSVCGEQLIDGEHTLPAQGRRYHADCLMYGERWTARRSPVARPAPRPPAEPLERPHSYLKAESRAAKKRGSGRFG